MPTNISRDKLKASLLQAKINESKCDDCIKGEIGMVKILKVSCEQMIFDGEEWHGCPFCIDNDGSSPKYCTHEHPLRAYKITDDFVCPLDKEE